jgi:hypothetical protein
MKILIYSYMGFNTFHKVFLNTNSLSNRWKKDFYCGLAQPEHQVTNHIINKVCESYAASQPSLYSLSATTMVTLIHVQCNDHLFLFQEI